MAALRGRGGSIFDWSARVSRLHGRGRIDAARSPFAFHAHASGALALQANSLPSISLVIPIPLWFPLLFAAVTKNLSRRGKSRPPRVGEYRRQRFRRFLDRHISYIHQRFYRACVHDFSPVLSHLYHCDAFSILLLLRSNSRTTKAIAVPQKERFHLFLLSF